MQNPELSSALTAGAFLAGSAKTHDVPKDLQTILISRLSQYDKYLGRQTPDRNGTLEYVQMETAREALDVIQRVQEFLVRDNTSTNPSASTSNHAQLEGRNIMGTRDMAQLRTLMSIVFKWAIDPLLGRVSAAIPSTTQAGKMNKSMKIIDLTTVPEDYKLLSTLLARLIQLVLPNGVRGPMSTTHISLTLIDRHLTDLLKPCIVLGWLPKSFSSDSFAPLDDVRPLVVHLFSMLPVSKVIAALSGVLSEGPGMAYVRKACSFLLSRQLVRREGVRGMFWALFGEEEISGEAASLAKLEHVSTVLQTLPAGMKETDYYSNIVSQLLAILSTDQNTMPSAYIRAAAFSLSRMITSDETTSGQVIVSHILLPVLQRPFLQINYDSSTSAFGGAASPLQHLSPTSALLVLQTLLTNTDPSPTLISCLLTPIIPPLYALSSKLEELKTADPALKTSVQGFLRTWGRLIGATEGAAALWLVVDGEGGEWKVDITGEVSRVEETETRLPSLSLFTPEDLERAEEAGDFDVDANILNLRPDPVQFVQYLKSIDRPDITSEIFIKLLGGYQELKSTTDSDPMRTLLYLQIIMQIQSRLTSDDSPTNILKKPDHILSFVKHALESASLVPARPPQKSESKYNGLNLADLRIVEEEEEEAEEGGDSDDEYPEAGAGGTSDDEMTITALNLLLSILEANPDLSAQSTPILNDIFELLEPISKEGPEEVKPPAREARMVLIARLASSSIPSPSKKSQKAPPSSGESTQETYKKALKLLQDPLLPVRAHGLLLLRQLVSSRPTKSGKLEEPSIDRALIPGILSIFLQSLQDDDSYIFLNAVQGLAAMVDGFGKDVLKSLVDLYSKGLEGVGGGALTKQDVDTRTRVGEALGQVIRRCGGALPIYADILIPPLFRVVRISTIPTTLRTSALSLLALCVNTNSLALLPYTTDLTEAMVNLLQVETVAATQRPKAPLPPSPPQPGSNDDEEEEKIEPQAPTMDSQPTAANPKFPPLRRAALHFLSLLTRSHTTYILETSSTAAAVYCIPPPLLRRARNIVEYLATTDDDNVVRVMARETVEGLDRMGEALLGL